MVDRAKEIIDLYKPLGFGVQVEKREKSIVVSLSGSLTFQDSAEISKTLQEQVKLAGGKKVVVNLAGVEYVDSGALAAFVEALKQSWLERVPFVFVNPSDKLRKTFEIARLDKVFEVSNSIEDALKP